MIDLPDSALLLGRVWRAGIGPSLVTLRAGRVLDITTRAAPTMRDLLEQADITAFVAAIDGVDIGSWPRLRTIASKLRPR
jgi:fumarylacetoacetate (FAA) hydrolase family protein